MSEVKKEVQVTAPWVYRAINAVGAEMATMGIAKDKTNKFQNYKFRGIDDVYNALAPIISKHSLVITPRVIKREVVERVTKKDEAIFYVVVEMEFDFISAIDGSKHTAKTFGEAMDSSDKATNKAMSAAYKYVAFQTFCIPTEGDNDADAGHHEVKPNDAPQQPVKDTKLLQATTAKDNYIKRLTAAKSADEIKEIMAQCDAGNLSKLYPEFYQSIVDERDAALDLLARKGGA